MREDLARSVVVKRFPEAWLNPGFEEVYTSESYPREEIGKTWDEAAINVLESKYVFGETARDWVWNKGNSLSWGMHGSKQHAETLEKAYEAAALDYVGAQ